MLYIVPFCRAISYKSIDKYLYFCYYNERYCTPKIEEEVKTQLKLKGSIVTLRSHESACQRTKNRIADNGPDFTINLHTNNCVALGGVEAVMVISQSTDWMGWLPVNEVTVA